MNRLSLVCSRSFYLFLGMIGWQVLQEGMEDLLGAHLDHDGHAADKHNQLFPRTAPATCCLLELVGEVCQGIVQAGAPEQGGGA